MVNGTEKITKLHLQPFGLSEYTIEQLIKGLNAVSTSRGLPEYLESDLKTALAKRLANPRVKAENQAKLQRLLLWLNGESNVIPVDFLQGLSSDEKIEVLRRQAQELEVQEEVLAGETARLLVKARKMVASK